jgi:hypothetical protein
METKSNQGNYIIIRSDTYLRHAPQVEVKMSHMPNLHQDE